MRAALHASGLSLPIKRITVNLAPADLPKEGSHYDLPIALALMAAMGAIAGDQLSAYVCLGELALDGTPARQLATLSPVLRLTPGFDVSADDRLAWIQYRPGRQELWLATLAR